MIKQDKKIRIGDIIIDFEKKIMREVNGEPIQIQKKVWQVLQLLVIHYPGYVSRDVLIKEVWQDNYLVGDKALNTAIWHLRKIFHNDDIETPIETRRGKGYQLVIQPVEVTNIFPFQSLKTSPILTAGIVASVLLGFSLWFFSPVAPITNLSPESVTNHPGLEIFSSVSPDGNQLAYLHINMHKEYEVFIQNLNQKKLPPQRLDLGKGIKSTLVWSSNSEKIYYAHKIFDENYCMIKRYHLKSQSIDDIAQCRLSRNVYLALSHDDKHLLFTGKINDTSYGLLQLDLTQMNKKPVIFSCENCDHQDKDVAYSPDGKYLAISRRTNKLSENLFVRNIESGDESQLTFNETDLVGFSWLDKKHLLVASRKHGTYKSMLINRESKVIKHIDFTGFSYPSVSNNGSIYYSERGFVSRLTTIELPLKKINQAVEPQTSQIKKTQIQLGQSTPVSYIEKNYVIPRSLLESKLSFRSPHYSNSTKQLVYASNESGRYELWVSDANAENRQKITAFEHDIYYPRWSPDGSEIAFLSRGKLKDNNAIYIYDVEKKEIRQLPSPFANHNRPTWSHDGRSIITAVESGESSFIYQITLDGSMTQKLTSDFARYAVLKENGVLFYTKGYNDGLWIKNVSEKQEKKILSGDIFSTKYNWTLIDNTVVFHSLSDNASRVMQFDFNSQKLSVVGVLEENSLVTDGSFTYQENENRIVINQTRFPQADIKTINIAQLGELP